MLALWIGVGVGHGMIAAVDIPILLTKLHVPGRRSDTIARPRLLDRLETGLQEQRRLTLISAPAGYGKTTVATDWLHAQTRPFAWVGLDEADNDPLRFLTYLIAALQKIDPAYGTGARSLLQGSQSVGGRAALTLLINDLVEARKPLIVALDDYHLIRAPDVHALVEFLLEHAPDILHLTLLTREDPPLPLSRLRVRGQLTELRAADLRFTPEETAFFFQETLGLSLDGDAVATLSQRTEGWIASLQLAGLAMRSQVDPHAFLTQFGGSHRYVIDYLVDEVLRHQPPEIRDFLSRTSILDRFCAPLCDALMQDGMDEKTAAPAEDILQRLDRANLFLVALDERRTWYRYHHLFADVLRSGLAPEMIQCMHHRAAHWLFDAGLNHEAIRHALDAGDYTDAAVWIEAASGSLIRHGQIATLLFWLDALPEPVITSHPELAAAKAMGLLLTGQLDDVDSMLASLEESEIEPSPAMEGRLLAVRTWLADARGKPRSVETAERALTLLPEDAVLYRILALIPLSHTRTEAGDIVGSTEVLRDAYRLAEDADQLFAAMGALANLAFNLLEQGKRREALSLCKSACSRYTDDRDRPLPVLGLVYLPMATAYYIGDDLERAEHYAREGLALCRDLFSGAMAGGDAERVLAQVIYARGEPDAALAFLEEARQSAERQGVTHVALLFAATSAMLRLRQGETGSVERWLASLDKPLPRQVRSAYLAWLLADLRWDKAETLLADRAQELRESAQFGRLIYLLLMQAQAAAGQGRRTDALAHLDDALKYAAPEGYRRPFLDAPPEVQMLLPYVRTPAPHFVDDLIARSDLKVTVADDTPSPASQALVEPLSERELEVLGLIAAGLSNREIAERLFITVGTVKRHAHNLYGKLQVGNRTEAVARARALKLL